MTHPTKPPHGWTCFHCSETFTRTQDALEHFGPTESSKPGCMVRVSLGAERGLLLALREAEAIIARHMDEDSDTQRAMHQMQGRHSAQLLTAEEAGYERGLRDARREQQGAKQ